MTFRIFIQFGDKEGIQFEVHSDSGEVYMVTCDYDNGWLCDCKGCLLGHHLCKHILACLDMIKFIEMFALDDPRVFTPEMIV